MKLSNLANHTLIYGLADFLGRGFGIIVLPFLASSLSPNEFGVLELILTITTLIAIFINCGMNNATQRFYFDGDEHNKNYGTKIVSSGALTILFFGIISLIICLALVLFIYPYFDFSSLQISYIALIAAILLMVSNQWLIFIIDVTRLHFAPFKFLILTSLTRVLALAAATYAVVYLGWGIDGMLSMQALITISVIPLGLLLIRQDLSFKVELETISKLIKFGFPYIFMGLAYWLFGAMDRWMLAWFVSMSEAGIYAISFKLSSVVLFASTAFGQAWSPFALKLRQAQPDNYKAIYCNILYLLIGLMIIIGSFFAIFSGEIVYIFFPPIYYQSAILLSILIIGVIFQSSIHVTSIGISLENKTATFAKVAWITALLNLFLNLLLIPKFGSIGAAFSTTISYILLTALYFFYTQKFHRLPINYKVLGFLTLLISLILVLSLVFHVTELSSKLILIKLAIYFLIIFVNIGGLYLLGIFKSAKDLMRLND